MAPIKFSELPISSAAELADELLSRRGVGYHRLTVAQVVALGAGVGPDDPRLSDARAPLAHTQDASTISDLATWLTTTYGAATASALAAEVAARAAADSAHSALTTAAHGGLVAATDARLSDARAPLAHTQDASTISDLATWLSTHVLAGANVTLTPNGSGGLLIASIAVPTTDASLLTSGTLPDARLSANVATAAALATHGALTTGAHGGLVAASDARLSDARAPLAHNQDASTITSGTLADARLSANVALLAASNLWLPRQDIRASGAGLAAGLHVPWMSGDALPTLLAGSTAAGNNQMGVMGRSNSNSGVYGVSLSGIGVEGLATGTLPAIKATGSATGSAIEAYGGASATVEAVFMRKTTALTTSRTPILRLDHFSSATPAAGFGSDINLSLKSSTTASQEAAQLSALWTDPTHATRSSAVSVSLVKAGAALSEAMRLDTAGSATQTGLLLLYGGTLKRVKVGAADSGGTGQRLLTIDN
jgi:hypothetical protein